MADRSPPPLFDNEDDTFEEILESEVLPKSDVTTTEKNVVATSDVVVKSEQLPLTESTVLAFSVTVCLGLFKWCLTRPVLGPGL